MAKQRYINTKFWDDDYISNLDPTEKYLFLYFLTNTCTNISGVYEIPLKKVSIDTGIEKEMVIKMVDRFEKDKKIFYYSGWICVQNFIKNQNQKSPQVSTGIKNELSLIPKDILQEFIEKGYGIHTLSHLTKSNLTKSNIRASQSDAEEKPKKKVPTHNPKGAEIIEAFEKNVDVKNKRYYGNKTQREACDFLIAEYGFEKVMELIPKLKETNKTSFFQISNPFEMVEKIGKVFNDLQRKKVENKGRGVA